MLEYQVSAVPSPFYKLKDVYHKPEFSNINDRAGVYVWGFTLEHDYASPRSPQSFVPYYVGKSKEGLFARMGQHVGNLRGGNYTIMNHENLNCDNRIRIGDLQRTLIQALQSNRDTRLVIESTTRYDTSISETQPLYGVGGKILYVPHGLLSCERFSESDVQESVNWMLRRFCFAFVYTETPKQGEPWLNELEKWLGCLIGYDKLSTKAYRSPSCQVLLDAEPGAFKGSWEELCRKMIDAGLATEKGV